MRSVAKAALRIAVAAALLFLLFVGVGPLTGRYRVVTVLTGSMQPAADAGSLIVVTPIPLEDVREGDVLTYQIPVGDHRIVTHRVVEIDNQGTANPTVVTKGDANNAVDPWRATLAGDSAWKMRAAIPHAGSVIRGLRSPGVATATVRVIPVALVLLWLFQIWGRREHLPTDKTDAAAAH